MVKIEFEREDDGRWIADIPEIPGVLAYGKSQQEAATKAEALALRVVGERMEQGEPAPAWVRDIFIPTAA